MAEYRCHSCGCTIKSDKIPQICPDCAAQNSNWTDLSTGKTVRATSFEPIVKEKRVRERKEPPASITGKKGDGYSSSPSSSFGTALSKGFNRLKVFLKRHSLRYLVIVILVALGIHYCTNKFNNPQDKDKTAFSYDTDKKNLFDRIQTPFIIRDNIKLLESLLGLHYYSDGSRFLTVDIYSSPAGRTPFYYCSISEGDSVNVIRIDYNDKESDLFPPGMSLTFKSDTPVLDIKGFTMIRPDSVSTIKHTPSTKETAPDNKKLHPYQTLITLPDLPDKLKISGKNMVYLSDDGDDCYLKIYSLDQKRITSNYKIRHFVAGVVFVMSQGNVIYQVSKRRMEWLPVKGNVFDRSRKIRFKVPGKSLLTDPFSDDLIVLYIKGFWTNKIILYNSQFNEVNPIGDIPVSLSRSSLLFTSDSVLYAISDYQRFKCRYHDFKINFGDVIGSTVADDNQSFLPLTEGCDLLLQESLFGSNHRTAYDKDGNMVEIDPGEGKKASYYFMKNDLPYLVVSDSTGANSFLYSARIPSGNVKLRLKKMMPGADSWTFSDGLLAGAKSKHVYIFNLNSD